MEGEQKSVHIKFDSNWYDKDTLLHLEYHRKFRSFCSF